MSVTFNAIPANLRVPGPYIEINNNNANQGLSNMPMSMLLIGQKLSTGTATPLMPYLIFSADQAEQLFGAGSQLKHMVEKYLGVNANSKMYAIAQVDNNAGAAATGSILLTGPATASGTLSLYIGGRNVQAGVTSADSATTIAANLVAAINDDTDLPVTATVDGTHAYQVDLTAKHKGLCANSIDVRFNYQGETLPAGVGATITAMSGGTANPDVTAALAAIGDTWYTDFVMSYTDNANLTVMETELDTRFGPMKMLDGFCYLAISDTYSNLVTAGTARNNPHDSIMGAYRMLNPPYELAAMVGAACLASAMADVALPVQTLALPGALAPAIADRFTSDEQEILLNSGISTFNVAQDGTVSLQRVITTYQTNQYGSPDPSYLDIETMKTLMYLRYDTRTYIFQQFPRFKLADDGTQFGRGQNVVTPSIIRASLIVRAKLWEENGLVEDVDQFISDLIVERDGSDVDRVNSLIPPNIINQFRVFAGNLSYIL